MKVPLMMRKPLLATLGRGPLLPRHQHNMLQNMPQIISKTPPRRLRYLPRIEIRFWWKRPDADKSAATKPTASYPGNDEVMPFPPTHDLQPHLHVDDNEDVMLLLHHIEHNAVNSTEKPDPPHCLSIYFTAGTDAIPKLPASQEWQFDDDGDVFMIMLTNNTVSQFATSALKT